MSETTIVRPVPGQRLTAEQQALAAAAGLIRVNELPMWQFGQYDRKPSFVPDPSIKEFGRWDSNNGKFVCVTFAGDIFWGDNSCSQEVRDARERFVKDMSLFADQPKGFVWVPCSNGEQFLIHHLLQRLASPYCEARKGHTEQF